MELTDNLKPQQVAFFAQDELIFVTPNRQMQELHFLSVCGRIFVDLRGFIDGHDSFLLIYLDKSKKFERPDFKKLCFASGRCWAVHADGGSRSAALVSAPYEEK